MMYAASCINEDGQLCTIERDYPTKKDFYSDLRGNGYKVKFIASADNHEFEIACEKYHERLEKKRRISAIKRENERYFRELEKRVRAEVMAELAAEDQAAEDQAAEDQTAEDQTAEVQTAEVQTAEVQAAEEIKKVSYDVFKTFQAGNKFDIYFHKPDRWKFDRPPVIAKETEYSVYYCHERDKNDVLKFLNRNATR